MCFILIIRAYLYFTPKRMSFMEKEMINRLKIVLAEEQKSSKWLAE